MDSMEAFYAELRKTEAADELGLLARLTEADLAEVRAAEADGGWVAW